MLLTFNAETTNLNVSVNLTDDNTYEREEDFNGILTLVSTSPRVSISPDTAVATILDNEGKEKLLFNTPLITTIVVIEEWQSSSILPHLDPEELQPKTDGTAKIYPFYL